MIRNKVFKILRERNKDKREGKLEKERVNISNNKQLNLLNLDLLLLYLIKFLKGFNIYKIALIVTIIIKYLNNSR